MSLFINELFNNTTLWVAVLAWAIAQLLKILIEFIKMKKIDLTLVISSGGMPSSHSAFVTAMSVGIGLHDGFDSSLFAICAIISMVVMYDAAGVRRAAGYHATVINNIIETLGNPDLGLDKKLKELLGHSPIEVAAGAILGILLAILCIK